MTGERETSTQSPKVEILQQEENLRKWRRKARLVGLVNAGLGIGLEVAFLKGLQVETNVPVLRESIYGTLSIIPAYLVADGITDTIKGAHHYFGLTGMEKLIKKSRN